MKDFQVPEAVLSQLNECSGGGYILFTFDEEGQPAVYCQFDNAAYALASQCYVKNWAEAIDQSHINNLVKSFNPRKRKSD